MPDNQPGGPKLRTCGVVAAPGFIVPEKQTAGAWIVFDVDTGDVIAAKDPHGRYRPASIIKVLLALTAITHLDLDDHYTATAADAAMEGSKVGLGPGGIYSNRQLLQGLLMSSGNDAAHALAQQLGGDESTLAMVNELARSLGASDTRAASYSGLDKPGMSTSAYDLALFYRAAWENPVFAQLVATDNVTFPGYGALPPFQVWNDNHLLLNDPFAIGGKTGYTDDAKHTFAGAMNIGGRRLAAIVLDTTIDKGRAWQQAQRFLRAAYRTNPGVSVGTLNDAAVGRAPISPPSTTPSAQIPALRPAANNAAANTTGAAGNTTGPARRGIAIGMSLLIAVVALIALVASAVGISRSRRKGRATGKHRL